ncbi:adenylate/guanylate cyclase catalytic domain protein [Ostertagia ostertagi]
MKKSEMLLLWKFCSRGTLQDVIYNDQFVLDEEIPCSIRQGHYNGLGIPPSINHWISWSSYNESVMLWTGGRNMASFNEEILKDGEEKTMVGQKTAILYVAPEIRVSNENNKSRRVDQTWVKQSLEKRRSADIYAFGMVMYEILFRNLPYSDKTDISELVEKAANGDKVSRPSVQKDKQLHPDLQALLQDCWHDTPDARPSIRRVRLSAQSILKAKGSLVDSMTRMMEEYANNLEKLVNERTGMLEQATVRADKLLSQLLPKYVATEPLKNATASASEKCLFRDCYPIHGRRWIHEVVTLLNSVYSGFDEIINKFDTSRDFFQVETIGDAYMVVSGIPEENGKRHINNIAEIALEIMQFLETYRIPHRKSEQLVIRVGFHSGPVAAAVVGLNSPRYCLFGDTVNMASRMESSGEPGKIQLSEQSNKLLDIDYPEFVTTKRGEVDIKGKGECSTYWLIRKDNSYFNNSSS